MLLFVLETSRNLVMLDGQGQHVSLMHLFIFLETSRSLVLRKGRTVGLSKSTLSLLYIGSAAILSSCLPSLNVGMLKSVQLRTVQVKSSYKSIDGLIAILSYRVSSVERHLRFRKKDSSKVATVPHCAPHGALISYDCWTSLSLPKT
jgi:hypothetical protein